MTYAMRYKKGRKCETCGSPISMYNPYNYCWKDAHKYCEDKGISWSAFENKFSRIREKNKVKVRVSKYALVISEEDAKKYG